ncbi:hypothetical protein CIP107510_00796 [Corynebacterium diphtheriae]|uniref:hypothetical protein n=1 Tax=Corynebacterium diphtheriae TaxID=1717 RepID=UPI0008FB8A05|nr:hypothetical protein [Corynebacterium diphtheriae]MBG9253324.1 hypothetical protein [Corynebacterium diphtheriae bv. mitis]MBG9303148.1 hypothetical protein [Corynebacterium diphtheriae bv. mitis]OIR99501.1 hypothetical protein BHF96_09560 [Corynebacterium diphtheriae]OIS02904.1 hypothetical protein BHF97_01635 [Corynebacterium diphtheriae]CAB0501769.1 hypothetical protein CIP101352_00811 [Corynebacterium diphtheriae]
MDNIAMLMNYLRHDETAAILFTGKQEDGKNVRVVIRPRHRFMGGFVESDNARWVRMVATAAFRDGANRFGLVQRGTGKACSWATPATDVLVVTGNDATRTIHAAIETWMRAGQVRDVVSRFGLDEVAAFRLSRNADAVVVAEFAGGVRFVIDPQHGCVYPLPGSLNSEVVKAVTLDESTQPYRIAVAEKTGGLRYYCLADARVRVTGLHGVLAESHTVEPGA